MKPPRRLIKPLTLIFTDIRQNSSSQPFLSILYYGICLLSLGLIGIDVFFPFFLDKIGLNAVTIIGVFLSVAIVARIFFGLDPGKHFFQLNFTVITPLLSVTVLAMKIFQELTFANSLYAYLRVDYDSFTFVYLFFLLLNIPNFHADVVQNAKKLLPVLTPLYFYPLFLLFWIAGDLYLHLKKEDGVFEYITFFFFLCVSIVGILGFHRTRLSTTHVNLKRFFFVLFALMALFGFVIAGEEISWGQRIIGFSTPENIAEVNTQKEFNIHNNRSIFPFVYFAYACISTFFVITPLIRPFLLRISKNSHIYHWIIFFIPDWRVIPSFIPTLVYTYVRLFYVENVETFDIWEELSEMFFAGGLLLCSVHILLQSTGISNFYSKASPKKQENKKHPTKKP